MAAPNAGPPPITSTIVASALLGPFGVIWASRNADRARTLGGPTRRYWTAFWVSWLVSTVVLLIATIALSLLLFAVLAHRGVPAQNAAPPVASTSDTAAPTSPASAASNFPPLPPGADPALNMKPTVAAGEGALTKLIVTPIVQGDGAPVTVGQTITVNYVGVSYQTGQEFDSTWERGEAAEFPIGVGSLIAGWDQGLVGVKIGSRVQLDIPADLAYGDTGQVPGPLRFVVDVLAAN